ncbi:extracellular matrix protein 2 [Salminus brasiliensis]|uniref:extracellular matrix protein 2 n=1 Tax=Salminus brasiliensis TaxID=930266 RepID=UPI003B831D8E
MRSVWLLCVCVSACVGALAVEAYDLNALDNTGNNGTESDSPASDISDTPVMETELADSRGKKADGSLRKRHSRGTAADTQTSLGRTEAVWVELDAVLGRRDGAPGKLSSILQLLREEKKRLLDLGEERARRKKEDDDEDEEEEDDDDDDEEEEEEEEEEEGEEEGQEEEEENEEENEAANNSTASRDSFTDLLPEECQLGGGRISCKDIGMSHLPIITDLGVTILELSGNNLTRLPPRGLDGLPNLEEVDLSRNFLDDSSISLNFFKNLTKLKRLTLDGNGLVTIPRLPPSLEELRINDNKINQLLSQSFKGLSNLLVLELTGNILYEGSVEPWAFKPLKVLKHLKLDNNRFSFIPAGLPRSLEELRMSHNQMVEVQDHVLNKSVHLRVLDLSHNLLRENSIYPNAWINLPKLEALDLSHNQLSVVPPHLPRVLRQLSLQHNHIHAIPPYTLSHLRPGLQSLRLSHNQLLEDRLLGKAFRGAYKTLVELLLDNNWLESVPQNIRHFKNLQLLRLDHNRITSVPVKSVCKVRATEPSSLVSLHLENNHINVKRIPRTALSCIQERNRVILEPQTNNENQ